MKRRTMLTTFFRWASDLSETIDDTRTVNPGEVWEENEFWLELTWRIDPDGSLGIRQ